MIFVNSMSDLFHDSVVPAVAIFVLAAMAGAVVLRAPAAGLVPLAA